MPELACKSFPRATWQPNSECCERARAFAVVQKAACIGDATTAIYLEASMATVRLIDCDFLPNYNHGSRWFARSETRRINLRSFKTFGATKE